jgi:hypothetical protein
MLLLEMAEYGGEPFPPFCGCQEFMHGRVCVRMLANFTAFCKLRCHSQKYSVRAQTLGICYGKSKAVCVLIMRKVGVQLFNSSPFPIRLFDKVGSEIPHRPLYPHAAQDEIRVA